MRKEHAEHNEAVCDLLITDGNYDDWVVTTAFYSALHFACYKIFPFSEGNKTINDIDEYYTIAKRSNPDLTKHSCIKNLIKSRFIDINSYYAALFDLCKTARYHDYKISKLKATLAREHLGIIKTKALRIKY